LHFSALPPYIPARMPATAITLRVFCGGMRWRLSDTDKLEVWRGTTLLGTLTGRAVALLVEHQLLAVEVNGWLHPPASAELPPKPPVIAARRPLAKAPSAVPFTPADRAAQKARRRTRRSA
jgi:hypothetical protein